MTVTDGALTSCHAEDWASFEDIDLTGVREVRARIAAPYARGRMEVRLGSTSGTVIATMPGVHTGGWTTFKEFTVPVTETTGVHDLYIVFKDFSYELMNVDWIELLGESSAVPVTSVSISQESPTVQVGQTLPLTPVFTPADPAPTNQVVTWASDDTDVAMVNANGDVTGIETGTATITVTTEDGTYTDQVIVTVTENGPGTYYSTRLSGSPTEKYGLAKSLSVMPGDVVDIEVWAKYIDTNQDNWQPLLNNLIAAISIPSGGIFIDGGQPGSLGNETLPFTPLDNDSEPGVAPRAYLNYIIMDRDFNKVVDMGAEPITTAAREYGQNGPHERLSIDDIVVREAGFMYIYISNEGEELADVFFDDLKVTHTKSPVVEAQDYMPFGLTFNSYQRENAAPNRWKFQGQEHIDDLGLNWDSFRWRNHDPAIGRFFNVDPLADKYVYNSPYAFSENKLGLGIELEGMELVPFSVIGKGAKAVTEFLSSKGLSTSEQRAVSDSPIGAAKIYYKENRATAEKFAGESGLPGPHNGEGDALRHSLFNALNTQTAGEETAKALGDAHEEDRPAQPENEKTMDLHNNEVGRQLALDYPDASPKELAKMLVEKISKGELKVLDSDGNVINSSINEEQVKNANKNTEALDDYGNRKKDQ